MSQNQEETKTDSEPAVFTIGIDQIRDYEFRVKFDKEAYPELMLDEPPPVGRDSAPNPSRILAAAVGNCLSASLLFSARKLRLDVEGIHTTVKVWYGRNEKGRLRVRKIKVEIAPKLAAPDPDRLRRCLEIFEDYCVVTQSVRHGVEIEVAVQPQ